MVSIEKQSKNVKSIVEVLAFCKRYNLPARVVGRWVWCKFDRKPSEQARELLKSIGFRWIQRRQQWAHSCGRPSRPALSYTPWSRYQTTSLDEACASLGVKV